MKQTKQKKCSYCKGIGTVSLEKIRSLSQNKYYWKVIVHMVSAEIGDSKYATHVLLNHLFNGGEKRPMEDSTLTLGESTTNLKTKEFQQLLHTIRVWANEFLNLVIPLPTQVTEELLYQLEKEYDSMFY